MGARYPALCHHIRFRWIKSPNQGLSRDRVRKWGPSLQEKEKWHTRLRPAGISTSPRAGVLEATNATCEQQF